MALEIASPPPRGARKLQCLHCKLHGCRADHGRPFHMLTEFITVGEGGRDGSIWMSPAKSRPPLSYPRLRDSRHRDRAIREIGIARCSKSYRCTGTLDCAICKIRIARFRESGLRCFRNRANPKTCFARNRKSALLHLGNDA